VPVTFTRSFWGRCAALALGLQLAAAPRLWAQDDLDKLLDAQAPLPRQYVDNTFKATRVINLQSTEKAAPGALEFVISHRFGPVNGGAYTLWGLDQSTIRFGLQYGISRWLAVGVGRSSYQKTYDGSLKATLWRQSEGSNQQPVTLVYFGSAAVNTLRFDDPTRTNYFSSRLSYVHQLIIARKFSERLSLEVVPTLVHRNLVATEADPNLVYAVGVGGRFKLSKRTSLNAEYIYRIPPKDATAPSYANYYNSLSVGFDIETGGHVFQLHLSNSLPMIERGFVTETTESWSNGGIHMGFNISRDFAFGKRK
jgi:Membrane bound beta barrel domain (DUF5777)